MEKQFRLPHWQESLSVFLDRVREDEFKWGQWDCAAFAFSAVKAQTGVDFLPVFVGQYATWREAARWLLDNGYRSFKDAVTAHLGEPKHAAMAGRGDIVMRRVGNGNILGVCVGKHSWFLGDEIYAYDLDHNPLIVPSLVSWPTLLCDCCWPVAKNYNGEN